MQGEEAVLVVCGKEPDAATVYDINTGEKIMCIPSCVAPPCGLAFADGRLLAASRSDKDQPPFGSAIYLWAPHELHETNKSHLGEAIGPIACSKDGVYLVGGARSGIAYIWEVASGTLLKIWRAHKNAISCLAFSQDSSLIISGSIEGTVHTWSMISLFEAKQSQPHPHEVIERFPNFYKIKENEHKASISGILTVISGLCPLLITSSLDGSCKVKNLMTGTLLQTLALSSAVTTIAVDPLNQILLCGASDAAIYVIGLNGIGTQKLNSMLYEYNCQVLSGHKAPISALAFSSEGPQLISASKDCTVLVWDTRTWQAVRKLKNKMVGPVTNLLVIPNPLISRAHHGRRNHLGPKFATLEKTCKPTNEMNTFFLPSDFPTDIDSTSAYFQSSDLLAEQIMDLEKKRTPEALEMIVAINTKDQVTNQAMAKELTDMNMLLQGQVFNVMQVRASED